MPSAEVQRLSGELRDLQTERRKRFRAKNDLLTYASIIDIPTRPADSDEEEKERFVPIPKAFGAHHLLWLKCLQDVEDGKISRLLGLMPPGSAKSLYSSVCFPTHFMGRFSNKTVIVTGYGSDLPKKQGRWARSIVRQPLYKRIFGTELSPDSAAADEWTLTNGSEWKAVGILSGITGNRADGVVWDDLIKGRQDADSKLIRDRTWDEYVNSLRTRKKPGAWEVGINTRWHEDDPPGRILPVNYNGESGWIKGQDGYDWYVVCLPMVCERDDDPLGRNHGEWLWPEYFRQEDYIPLQTNPATARAWSALYQQRPAPETGNFFESSWFMEYGEGTRTPVPHRESLRIYGASDYAVTSGDGDYTVHIVAGVDPDNNVFILDLWRNRTSSDKWVEAFCDLVKEWRPLGWAEESGQIRAGVGPFIHKRLMERGLYIARAQFPTRGDKSIRAQSIRGRMAMLKVYFPSRKPWYAELRREMLTFPAGKNDDAVDAIGLVGQILDRMISGSPYKSPEEERPKILSTDPNVCNVSLDDVFAASENKQDRIRFTSRARIK